MSQISAVHPNVGGAVRNRERARSTAGRRSGASKTSSEDPFGNLGVETGAELCTVDRLAVRRAVQEANAARHQAAASQRQAADEFAETLALAQAIYLDFRAVANALFLERRDRVALGLYNRPPVDARAFVKMARNAYRAALEEPRLNRLAYYGYDAAVLQNALDGLTAVLMARQELVNAMSRTTEAMVAYASMRKAA